MKIHVVGVGGKGMAPAASLAVQAGHAVSGDDLVANHRTAALMAAGVDVTIGTNDPSPAGAELVVASTAVPVISATAAGPRVISRLGLVQELADDHGQQVVAVAGSLGKSTAATLLHHTLAVRDPSVYVGADVSTLLCGARIGAGDLAVVEACEYRDAYWALRPAALVVLNVHTHHEDWFGPGTGGFTASLERLIAANADRLTRVVCWQDVPTLHSGGRDERVQVVGFGERAAWRVHTVDAHRYSSVFRLDHHDAQVGVFSVPAPGRHMVVAAACAVVVGTLLGCDARDLREGMARFALPERRMSVVAEADGVVIVDDNARHPAQATALVEALRQAWPDRVVHLLVSPWGTLNRRDLAAWAAGLSAADVVWVLPVGECATTAGGAEDPNAAGQLATLVRRRGRTAYAGADPQQLAEVVQADRAMDRAVVVAGMGYDANTGAFTPFTEALTMPQR